MRRARTCILIGFAVTSLASACGEDEPVKDAVHEQATQHDSKKPSAWLQPGSAATPAQWLASRKEGEPRTLSDAEVKRIGARLQVAHRLYRESERMIANRAVQLEEMLLSLGVTESATEILDDLTAIGGEAGQTEGFGAVSQHYFNLRSNQIGRGEALATLKTRYGTRAPQ